MWMSREVIGTNRFGAGLAVKKLKLQVSICSHAKRHFVLMDRPPSSQTLIEVKVLKIPRAIAIQIIYGLRTPIAKPIVRTDAGPRPTPQESYDLLLDLSVAGSLEFSLEEVVRQLCTLLGKGAVE